ncbi:hypothetical protein QTG54_008537, partial [Skeletonema marinoi]
MAISTGCPGQHDSSNAYDTGDTVEDNQVVYTCSGAAAFCNLYEPNLKGVGVTYWTPTNSCTGTGTPTVSPVFTAPQDGCPEEFDSGTTYEPYDKVTVTRADDSKVVYACQAFPASQWCNVATYSPLNTDKQCNGEVCWPQAWTRIGGCLGSYSPTGTPTFDPNNVEGCPEEYDDGSEYEGGDRVSVTAAGEDYGKIYECKAWPEGDHCGKEAYSPLNTDKQCNGEVCWPIAWTYIKGCTGTITPTATPTFDPNNVEGCPEEYDDGTEYEEGDKVSVTAAGEDYGKIYECKAWPEAYSPLNTAKTCSGEVCWPVAWTYEGGCTGTITPTAAPVFIALSQWNKQGCPPEYVPNNSAYKPEAYVSVPKNEDNTYGVVWQCKNAMTAPWCQQEGYAPGSQNGDQAWEKVGFCAGTISPTDAPTTLAMNTDATKKVCQFKYKLETTDGGEYVILQAESWEKGGGTIATGGKALELYKPGHLVRNGRVARKCNNYPYSFYCDAWSPFVNNDSSVYNPSLSRQGWAEATCEDVESTDQAGEDLSGKNDEFDSNLGPVFASNGDLLVKTDGTCVNLAINPQDFFKSSPAVKGCQRCRTGNGFGSSANPTLCTPCQGGATSKIVNGRSQCVVDGNTPSQSAEPSSQPSLSPSPSGQPSSGPSSQPSLSPSSSGQPSSWPSASPSASGEPSSQPSLAPSQSAEPSSQPSLSPSSSGQPSSEPSSQPSLSASPSNVPSDQPSDLPSNVPTSSNQPSDLPSLSLSPSTVLTSSYEYVGVGNCFDSTGRAYEFV